jgi:predicted peptidase
MPMNSHPKKPGTFRGVLEPDEQRFTVSIPESYDKEKPASLILALHWGGPVWPFIGEALLTELVKPALGELGAVIVAPDRTRDDWANLQSEADVLRILDFIEENYYIDDKRILITGYSLGGIGTWYMGARHQDKFTAALPISANPPPEVLQTEWQIPLYVIHSLQDECFRFEKTEAVIKDLQTETTNVELAIVTNATHFETYKFIEPLHAAVPWIRRVWAQ